MTPISLAEYEQCRGDKAKLVALANRQRLKLHEAPSQSLFRVVALFYISFGPSSSKQYDIVTFTPCWVFLIPDTTAQHLDGGLLVSESFSIPRVPGGNIGN